MEKEWLIYNKLSFKNKDMSKVENYCIYATVVVGVNHQQRLKIAGENVAESDVYITSNISLQDIYN